MNKENQKKDKSYYFSHRLLKKLEGMDHHSVTVVEAPSGFGKTTAVREYLNIHKPHAVQHWYTCLGESPRKAWRGICDVLSMIDDATSSVLRNLDLPTEDTLADMALSLRSLRCGSETFFVIDNFQLVDRNIPRHLINAFSTHGNASLHIIFITQQLKEVDITTVHHANIYRIDNSYLLFNKEDISTYFRMAGIRLSDTELNDLNNSTEGWVSAIRLQLINYLQVGIFARTADIEQLVKIAVWNLLSDDEKEFLLSVSVLDGFTTPQAQIMIDQRTLPEDILKLLDENAFIRYFPEKDLYLLHSILQDYLRSRFYNHQPEEFQTLILRRAGKACAIVGDYYAAARFYYEIQDYEAIVSMPIDVAYLYKQKERDISKFITDFVNDCPEEILNKHPLTSVGFAFYLFMVGESETYAKLCRLITSVIQNPEGMSQAEFHQIKGEFALLSSFNGYNDIQKMSEGHKTALEHLGGPSMFWTPITPWTFGNVSVLNMFWRKTGELEKELDDMDECMPIYSKVARGHGVSANTVMRAEAKLLRGDDENSEALCHKALYLGRSQNQTVLCLCAELLLARIAILRGDIDAYGVAMGSLNRYTESPGDRFIMRAGELCTMSLKLMLGETKGLADWIYDIEHMKKVLYLQAMPYGHMLYGKLLLTEKRYNELYGLSELMMGMAEEMHYLLPQVYHLIYFTVAKYRQGRRSSAQESLVRALHIALPDKIYMPFAEHAKTVLSLLELARPAVSDWEGLDMVRDLCERQEMGMKAINRQLLPQEIVLTSREREIALLAKDGLTVKQIAEGLFISENTVKSALRSIYGKLDVHSKVQLAQVNF